MYYISLRSDFVGLVKFFYILFLPFAIVLVHKFVLRIGEMKMSIQRHSMHQHARRDTDMTFRTVRLSVRLSRARYCVETCTCRQTYSAV